jgi:enamine deaminase RidA (YjgF/YER057c/UK114 family)
MLVRMTPKITPVNPDQLHAPLDTTRSPPSKQHEQPSWLPEPDRRDGVLVGDGDIDAQIDHVVRNSMIALGTVGAEPNDVVRTVIYVVSDDTSALGAAWERLTRSPLGPAFTTASTLVGVAQRGFRGQQIEVDLTAALPGL